MATVYDGVENYGSLEDVLQGGHRDDADGRGGACGDVFQMFAARLPALQQVVWVFPHGLVEDSREEYVIASGEHVQFDDDLSLSYGNLSHLYGQLARGWRS
jgi:hypothetical protein